MKDITINNFTGHVRTRLVKINIMASLFFKSADISLSFLLVSIFLELLGSSQYGLWLTIISVIDWFSFFDVGLGHGLRNKYAHSLAEGEFCRAKAYISTAYCTLASILLIVLVTFFVCNTFLDWNKLFNAPSDIGDISALVVIVFVGFVLRLLLKLVNSLFAAIQKTAIVDFTNFLTKSCIFILVVFCNSVFAYKINLLAIVYSFIPVLVLLLSTLYFFRKEAKGYFPSIRNIKRKVIPDLMNLGLKFFIIQVSMVVLFASDNIIISHLFGLSEVVPYQVAHKYFGIVLLVSQIFVAPIWSSVTEAYVVGDFRWIKKLLKKYKKLWLWSLIVASVMYFVSDHVYLIWIGEEIKVNSSLSFFWALFVVLQSYNMIITNIINGIGKIKIQVYTAISSILINIPLSIFISKYLGFGTTGVVMATDISIFIYILFRNIQLTKILNKTDYGVWGV